MLMRRGLWHCPGGSKLRLGAQTIYQSSNGIDSIGTFSVGYGGVKADLTSGGLTGTLGYNQTGRNSSLRTPYSSWAGYTSMLIKDFYDAGQKAVLVGATYDFKGIELPGLTLGGQIATGWDAINPSSGAALANSTEYDLDLNYRFNDKSWPKWVQPLWIRMRAGVLVPTSRRQNRELPDHPELSVRAQIKPGAKPDPVRVRPGARVSFIRPV